MTRKEAEALLDRCLTRITADAGSRRIRSLEYARVIDDLTASLSWPCRLDPRGFVAFTCIVGLSYEKLAQWLRDESKGFHLKFGTPIHFLRSDPIFVEWTFNSERELEALVDDVSNDIFNVALPFINKYADLSRFRKAVKSSEPADWINLGLNVDSRIAVHAAVEMAYGERATAVRTLEAALSDRKSALPKNRIIIEQVLKRIRNTT